ncbi:DUF2325 domain-containing protein [Variovorax humicola]|uniref:DUF2325 domain-containing protein n=1 Tax=Variovorax humicola TaxID=1769758 RepID=A0ABU8VU92_9BURK
MSASFALNLSRSSGLAIGPVPNAYRRVVCCEDEVAESTSESKGMLVGAQIVVFPVDCVDHDSVTNLKRLCARHEVPFLPLRTASVTCFAAALLAHAAQEAPAKPAFRMCLRHG